LIDFETEKARIAKDVGNLDEEIARIDQRLADENFVSRAKPEIVERERERRAELARRCERLQKTWAGIEE